MLKTKTDYSNFKPDTVFYHGKCFDGLGAAYVFWKKYGDEKVNYIPSWHYNFWGTLNPDTYVNKVVVFVDICPVKDVLKEINKYAKFVLVLDHHKTAPESVESLKNSLKFGCVIDMKKSGCVLAYNFCYPNEVPPKFLLHIEDRDIWKWSLKDTKAFSNYIFLHTDLEDFMVFKSFTRYEKDLTNYIKEGETMELLIQKQISNAIKASQVVNFMGYKVALSQTSVHISEVGNTLVKNYEVDFAMIWHYHRNKKFKGIKISLRSIDTKVDVSEIAKKFGGGGHRNASGFVWKGDSIEKLITNTGFSWKYLLLPGILIVGFIFGKNFLRRK